MIGLCEFLKTRGVDTSQRIKIVRHQDSRFDMLELEEAGLIELYQAYQTANRFNCDYVVSTIGEEYPRSRFLARTESRVRCQREQYPSNETSSKGFQNLLRLSDQTCVTSTWWNFRNARI